MDTHLRLHKSGLSCQPLQFMGLERRLYRDRAIVQRDRVPAKQPSRCRQEVVCKHVPFEIRQQDRSSRDTPEFLNQLHHLIVREVMEEQGTEHDVETSIRERYLKRIRRHLRLGRMTQVFDLVIEREYRRVRMPLPYYPPHVARCGAGVQKRECLVWFDDFPDTLPQYFVAAEQTVDSNKIPQTRSRLRIWRLIENLMANDALPHGSTIQDSLDFVLRLSRMVK